MSLIIGDNFSYQGQDPLDARLVTQSLTTLLAIPNYTIYDGIQVYVLSEKKYYVYDSNNTNDPVLGKWIELEANGSSSIPDILKYSKAFTVEVNKDETISFTDLSGVTNIADLKVNQLVNDIAGIIAKVISIDTTNNQVQIRVLSKDTIIKNDTIKYNGTLDAEIDKVQTINYADVDTTEAIADFSTNNLIYDENGILAKVLNKDTTNNELTVIPITLSIAIGSHEVYLTNSTINPKISSQTTVNFTDLVTSKLITDVEKTQLVYDMEGTLAKIDSIDITTNNLVVTTINTSSDKSVKIYKYLGTNLSKVPDFKSSIDYADLDTTQLLNTIKVDELVYDEDGTLAKIVMVDVPNAQLLVQTLTASGMPYAPILKELVIKDGGTGYTINDVIEANNVPGVFGKITDVDTNGSILSIVTTTSTTVSTTGTGAVVDYDTVIYGAYGKNWAPLSNTSSSVAQIVTESFTYESGFNYEITNGGTGYAIGDIVNVSGNMIEVTKVNSGVVEEVRWSREIAPSTTGTGLTLNVTSSNDSFIIPTDVWNNSQRNSYDLTNDEGATVEFNRLDGVTQKCSAGDGSIYKFTFDSTNGVIYQEKTDIESGNGIGPFVPYKNYKKDDIIINDNTIYICKDDHTASATLGDDGSHWKELRKAVSSGSRYVKFTIPKQTKPVNSWNTISDLTYEEGDQSLLASDKLIAPVSGLYYFNVSCIQIDTAVSNKHSITRVVNNTDANVVGLSQSSGNWQVQPTCSGLVSLKSGDSLRIESYYVHMPSTGGYTSEFGLLSDDKENNLIAEATLTFSNQEAGVSKIMKFTNSSNPAVISSSGIITLPEDGDYLLAQDQSLMTTTAADHAILTRILKGSVILYDYQSTGAQSKYSNSYVFVLSGLKGDTFSVDNRTSIVLNNRTLANDPKIRLFKIKSVDYHIDSHDLYKDSGSSLSYEDWITNKLKNEQLTVTVKPTYDQSFTAGNITIKTYTYVSGESSMFKDGIKFVAPISGLYNLNVNPISKDTAVPKSFAIIKKNALDASWDYGISLIESTSTAWTGSISTTTWLEKGDYLTVGYRSNEGSFSVIQQPTLIDTATFTLINAGITSNYEVGKPHLWPVSTEVNLGDGLYGRRVTGTINANAFVQSITDIINDNSGIHYQIVSYGGWWSCYGTAVHEQVGGSRTPDGSTHTCSSSITTSPGNQAGIVRFHSISSQNRVNAPYDIWVTYTK